MYCIKRVCVFWNLKTTKIFQYPIVNFPFIFWHIPGALAYGMHIFLFIRHFRARDSYHYFIARGLLIERKLRSQYFLIIRLKLSLLLFYGYTMLTVGECFFTNEHRCVSICRNHNPIISSFMSDHWVCTKSTTTGVTSFCGIRIAKSLVFCVVGNNYLGFVLHYNKNLGI